jgi:hypothetical protein
VRGHTQAPNDDESGKRNWERWMRNLRLNKNTKCKNTKCKNTKCKNNKEISFKIPDNLILLLVHFDMPMPFHKNEVIFVSQYLFDF